MSVQGFRKVDPDQWEFANEGFLRDQKQLLKSIVRKRPSHVQQNQQQTQVQNSPVGACVEVGKFGIEEEVERLKRDKNVLMQELVRLRQQQQATEHQLQNVGQKVQVMEQRQQQTMSFLAKAVQSPGFLNQLVQQNNNNDGNKHIQGSNKKRRLPGDDEQENCKGHDDEANGLNRQIVKYEAAQTMLRQILNRSSSSPRCESVSNRPESFLLDDTPTTNSLNSADRVSGPSPSQGVAAAAASWSPESDLVGFGTGDGVCFDPIMAALGGSLEIESDEISPVGEGEVTELQNEAPKLPGVQDSFWEQFFADETPLIEDDILSGAVENSDIVMEQQEMNHLTEQMELLSSATQRK
ncbi:heat stress transcription factor A-1b isoform X2 [Raphanus sativus]|uniref:Heat stress transcription factor A-1b isoform X2 n=1 Tax=Raphanus sativus TaxID=3726 RepID=A0A6J0LRK4_RAPSA|nr:heat stress transcription factor A-1b isoform X2 [Raphanus sativus]